MAGPFDYVTPNASVNPFASSLQGFGLGQQLAQQQQNQQLQAQQIQSQLGLQRQYQQDSAALLNNPNAGARDFAAFQLKYPQFKEATKGAFDALSADQQANKVGTAARVYSALNSGRADLATSILDDQIKALENSNADPREINALKGNRQLIETLPIDQARNAAGMFLSTIADPKQFASIAGQLGKENREQEQAPSELRNKQLTGQNLESQISTRAADLEIRRNETQIKALEAQLKREDNDLKRQDLQGKLADAQEKRDQLKRTQESDASAAFSTIDRTLDTIGRLKTHPGLSGAVGFRVGQAAIPGTDAADASALIDQLQSQGFLAEVDKMRGLGALTEAEGKKLTSAIGSLDKNQSEKQFRKNLDDIQKQFDAARSRIEGKFGTSAPKAEVVVTSKRFGPVTQRMIDDLAASKGVSQEVARQFFESQ